MVKDFWKKKNKPKKNWGAIIFLVFIVTGLSSGFVFFGFHGSGEATHRYEGITFHFQGDHWRAKIKGANALFTFRPDQVRLVEVEGDIAQLLNGKLQVDTTSSINDTLIEGIALAQYQMGLTLNNYNTFLRPGFIEQTDQFPTITCAQATPFVPVILFEESNQTRITVEGNCIRAEAATHQDIIVVKDRILYELLEVI